MSFNRVKRWSSRQERKAKTQRYQTAADIDLAAPEREAARRKQEENRIQTKMSIKERCKRAATFRRGQDVRVDGMPGIGRVTDVDGNRLGTVTVRHPGTLQAIGYNPDVVHALDEKKDTPDGAAE